ncbi:MAG: AI-2E family transporter [Clostridiales bacterium]|jgi:predicted PurR-regulated permease PerM|nr:AI-2E family transporter [Clostridiales bacterium]
MKLPWDRHYLKTGLHIVVLVAICYIVIKLINAAAYTLSNLGEIGHGVSGFFSVLISVLTPLITALVVAYVLDPLAEFLQKIYDKYFIGRFIPFCGQKISGLKSYIFLKDKLSKIKFIPFNSKKSRKRKSKEEQKFKPRTAGAALSYIVIAIGIAILVFNVVNRVGKGKGDFTQNLIASINSLVVQINNMYARIQVTLVEYDAMESVSGAINDVVKSVTDIIKDFSANIVSAAAAAGGMIAQIILGLVAGFYFLRDKQAILDKVQRTAKLFIPAKPYQRIANVLDDTNAVFSGYIRGQLTDAAVVAILLSIGLSIVGVEFAPVLGIMAGLGNLIPYFGAAVAFAVSVVVALFSGPPITAVYAAIVILVIQQIDGAILNPKIVGNKVELSPVIVILSLAIAGTVFGIAGMIFAVPVCAVAKIFLTRYVRRKTIEKIKNEETTKEIDSGD